MKNKYTNITCHAEFISASCQLDSRSRNKFGMTMISYLVLLLVACCLALISASKASAEGVSLKVEPANLQIKANPPADVRAPFTLTNNSNEPVEVSLLLKVIKATGKANGETGFVNPAFTDDRGKESFLQSVQILDNGFAISSITLSPRQKKQLELSITVDKNAPPLDHYFSLVFLSLANAETLPDDQKADTTSETEAGVSMPVLVSINTKQEPSNFFITEFSSPFFLQSGPVPFTLKIENSEPHFITPRGVMLITNSFGQTVGRIDIPKTNIMAGNTRAFSNNGKSSQLSESPDLVWSEKFLVGFYTATLSIGVPGNETLYTRTIHFFAFPFIAFLYLGIFIFFSFLLVKKIKKRLAEE